MRNWYAIRQVAVRVGQPYHRIHYAITTGKIPRPQQVGNAWILTDDDILRLREYFSQRDELRRQIMAAESRDLEEQIPSCTSEADE